MRRAVLSLVLLLGITTSTILLPSPVHAQEAPNNCARDYGGFLSFPTWYKYLEPDPGDNCSLRVEIPGSAAAIGLAVFEIILRIGGLAAVFAITWGGYLYILSGGEPDKAAQGRTTIVNALVGLFITMLSVAIVNLIGRNI